MIFTSRSRFETFLQCPRRGYWNYLHGGRGVTLAGSNIALSTGSAVHEGLAAMFRELKAKPNIKALPHATALGIASALTSMFKIGDYQREEGEEHSYQEYVGAEQKALVEGLLWCFAYQVAPDWIERYNIVDVEREERRKISNNPEIWLEGKIDLVLEEKSTGDLYVVSFKTSSSLDSRLVDSYRYDIQGVSESWLLEQRIAETNQRLMENSLKYVEDDIIPIEVHRAAVAYNEAILRAIKPQKVAGVIMCVLLKNRRYERVKGSGKWETLSPLIKGYRKLVGSDIEYAHSWQYSNSANFSGKSILGKGWEPFDIWDSYEGGIKEWVAAIAAGEIQPEERVLAQQIWQQTYYRNDRQMGDWLDQHQAMEEEFVPFFNGDFEFSSLEAKLNNKFWQNRKACMYPRKCDYLAICDSAQVEADPIGSGLYEWREPHHEGELASLVQIEGSHG